MENVTKSDLDFMKKEINYNRTIETQNQLIDKQNEKITEVIDSKNKLEKDFKEHSDLSKKKDFTISNLESTLERRDEKIKELEGVILDKSKRINELTMLLPYKEKTNQLILENTALSKKHLYELELKQLALNRLERLVKQHENKIIELESEIDEFYEDDDDSDEVIEHEEIQMPIDDESIDKQISVQPIVQNTPLRKDIIEATIVAELVKGNGKIKERVLEGIDGITFDSDSEIRKLCKGGSITLKKNFMKDDYSVRKY
jgi:hypothetical protein